MSLYEPWLQDRIDEVMFSHIQVKKSDTQSEGLPENFESGKLSLLLFTQC